MNTNAPPSTGSASAAGANSSPKINRMNGSAPTIANASPPKEAIASSSAASVTTRNIRSRSAIHSAAMIGAIVVITVPGTKCTCSRIR